MEEARSDFVPAAYPHEIELQNLVATVDCTSKEMLPKWLQEKPRSVLSKEIQEIKLLLGERG
jgi:hypothetical protein